MKAPATAPLARWLYPALFAAVVLVYWIPRLFRGFWVDEAGMYWFVHDGWARIWPHVSMMPSESVLYSYITYFFSSAGPLKEPLLRLPAVAGMLASALMVWKLAESIAGGGSGWPAAIMLGCAGAMVDTATNARPYAVAVAVVLASFWTLREWVRKGEARWLAGYCAAAAAIVYLHYLFALAFGVHAIYLLAARRAGRNFSWARVAGAAAIVAAAAAPLGWHALHAVQTYQVWGRATPPTAATLASFYPLQVLFPAVVGMLLYWFLYREWFGVMRFPASEDAVLLTAWLSSGPILLFVLARTSSYMLFATRYLVWALPPFFIVLAWCIGQVGPERARFALVSAIAASAALYVPQMRMNEWRTPVEIVRSIAGAETPVLVRSGVVQSAALDWKSEPRPDSYLFAPLTAYPLVNPILPVPFFVNAAAARYLEQEIERREPEYRQFCVMAETGSDVLEILPRWLKQRGYSETASEASGFTILLFRRPERAASTAERSARSGL